MAAVLTGRVDASSDRATLEGQLLELMDEHELDHGSLTALAGDGGPSPDRERRLEELERQRGPRLYSDALFCLTQERFRPDRARELWAAIVEHKELLSRALGRNVGVTVAALDYLSNVRRVLARPLLIGSRKMAQVAEVALKDGMTGLFDHATFMRQVEAELTRARRYRDPVSLVLMDIDDFKAVNDVHGHLTGDEVLANIGGLIDEIVREVDVAGRYGGEEFAVLMPRTEVSEALAVAERLRRAIARARAGGVGVTISAGVAAVPDHADDASSLVRAADDALYRAKAAGKDRVLPASVADRADEADRHAARARSGDRDRAGDGTVRATSDSMDIPLIILCSVLVAIAVGVSMGSVPELSIAVLAVAAGVFLYLHARRVRRRKQ